MLTEIMIFVLSVLCLVLSGTNLPRLGDPISSFPEQKVWTVWVCVGVCVGGVCVYTRAHVYSSLTKSNQKKSEKVKPVKREFEQKLPELRFVGCLTGN